MKVRLQETKDGSHTLFDADLNETYHSRQSALQESQYVYIEMGFEQALKHRPGASLQILEIGFGTGLNIWLTLLHQMTHRPIPIQATTLEPFPLPQDLWSQLNYAKFRPEFERGQAYFDAMHKAAWDQWEHLDHHFDLLKRPISLESALLAPESFDLVYFDAFAPSKQPDIWSRENFQKIYAALKPRAWLTTYCASSSLKKNLKSVGFKLHILPGPLSKREMVCAQKI